MDKNAIKKYAIWARRELISRVSQKAAQYAIIDGDIADANAETINGIVLTNVEKTQRRNLIAKIKEKGYEQVMEEVAYTWFNRFCALRFMEVNNYLPSHVRVFTNEENEFRPQIIDEAIHLELEGLNMQKVYAFKETNDNEGLYKYLVITQCNALGKILPGMFEHISDYTELLFPDNILREGSIIEQMIALIPQEDWLDAVQIIGWLYQFYNTEPKADVFGRKTGKISKDEIPAATQLFTPDWIVRYMVENSVGRWYYDGMQGWLQDSPDVNRLEVLKSNWKYYLDEAEQTEEVQAELDKLRSEKCPDLDEFKVIDPCMGSGHILVYAFDVLMQIYESCGYSSRDAVKNIVEKNLYGLDIDERAAQLAYFAVMMKARQYDRRFFAKEIRPNVYAIPESNNIDKFVLDDFIGGNEKVKENIGSILSDMYDAKEYGSIINVAPVDFECLYERINEKIESVGMFNTNIRIELLPIVKVAEILSQKYDVVITNPPYLGISATDAKMHSYVTKNYPDSKSDLYSVFIEKCYAMLVENGFQAMITMHSWMFLTSFEKLRQKLQKRNLISLVHLGARAFEEIGGEVVQTCSFTIQKKYSKNYLSTFCRLIDAPSQQTKEDMFLAKKNRFYATNEDFSAIPGNPLAYHSDGVLQSFKKFKPISKFAISRAGLSTGNNDKYLRFWYEPDLLDIGFNFSNNDEYLKSDCKYVPCNKGGSYRKWYGNNEYVIDWSNPSEFHRPRTTYMDLYYKPAITWSVIISGDFNCRYYGRGFLFDHAAASLFCNNDKDQNFLLGFMNTNVYRYILRMINPTINSGADVSISIPVCRGVEEDNISAIAQNNVTISQKDWDSFETSWDFKKHPLVPLVRERQEQEISQFANSRMEKFGRISWHFENWKQDCNCRISELKHNEEELNRIFIDIYGLQDELSPDVSEEDITVRKADLQRDIKSFISYAVGCMLGRYSLYQDGLFYAGGYWDSGSKIDLTYDFAKKCGMEKSSDVFIPDYDNIIPICDDEYFEDDIVGKFVKFVETVYGKDTLEENLQFIADALGGKGANPKDVIRKYFLNDFFADHCKIYQKRPIYWLFDSGKKNGFKALVYMHRYREDTIARMRTDYVHEQQSRYRTAIEEAEHQMLSAKDSERVKITKALNKLKEQDEELRVYEEKIHHLADQMIRIDLDDGVKNNYELFKDVLAKIK